MPGAFHVYIRQSLVKKLKQARELGGFTEHLRSAIPCKGYLNCLFQSALLCFKIFLGYKYLVPIKHE